MRKVLITGSDGQLGTVLKYCSKVKDTEYIFHNKDTLDITNIPTIEKYFSENKIDYIVNCSAYTNFEKCEENPEKAYQINVNGVENLAKISHKYNSKLIHISTNYIFKGDIPIPLTEEITPSAISIYGKTKYQGEEKILKNTDNFVIIRTAWVYSKYCNNFLKSIIKLAKEKKSLNVVYDQIGTPTFAYGLATVINKFIEEKSVLGIFNFTDEGAISWYDFAYSILKLYGLDCEINPVESSFFGETTEKRPKYAVLNKNKIKNLMGIEISHWYENLEKFIFEIKKENP